MSVLVCTGGARNCGSRDGSSSADDADNGGELHLESFRRT
jgi:hypothetical protein